MSALNLSLARLSIRGISVSEMDNNVYVLTARHTGAQVLIDAADDAPAVLDLLSEAASDTDSGVTAEPVLIITTHSHWDHVRALRDVVVATGAPTAAGRADAPDIQVRTDVLLDDGEAQHVDGLDLQVIALRGHTPGSVALLYRDPDGPPRLFTGDSLFPGGLGNTGKDPARFHSLYTDVVERIFNVLPDETVVYPGHGKSTTLGAERPQLADWLARGW